MYQSRQRSVNSQTHESSWTPSIHMTYFPARAGRRNKSLGTWRHTSSRSAGHRRRRAYEGCRRKAVATLEETESIARRVLGGAHPLTSGIEDNLRYARAALRTREAPPRSA